MVQKSVLLLVWALALPVQAQTQDEAAAVKEAVLAFIDALDQMDLEREMQSFTDDATMFFPFTFTPNRLDGRDEIAAAQQQGFEGVHQQLAQAGAKEPYRLNLHPTDMLVQMLGTEAAVVTWHSHRPTNAGRRTAVLHKVKAAWLIASFHASNLAYEN